MNKYLLVLLIAIVASETVIPRPDFKEFKEKLLDAVNWEDLIDIACYYGLDYAANLCVQLLGNDVCKSLMQQIAIWCFMEGQQNIIP